MKAGWEVKKLGEVCDLQNGYAFKSNDYVEFSNTLNIRMSSIRPDGSFDSEHNQRFLPDSYASEYKSFLLSDDDLIIAMTDMAGDPKILGVPTLVSNKNGRNFLMNQRVGKLFGFSEQINVPYLRYFLTSPLIKELYKNKGAGGLQINISKADILSVDVPFSNIKEQQRIVAILDQAFEGIAKARANAEQNLQNARALFESHLQSVFTQRGEGWIQNKLAAFTITVSTGPFGSLLHKSDYVSEGVPLVNPINIVNNCIIPNESKQINVVTKARLQSYVLKEGDIVIGRRGEIGRCAVVSEKESGWICGTGCFFIRPLPTTNPQFLANLIRSSSYREKLEQASSGATMLNLSNKALCNLEIAMPSFEGQKNILKKIDALSKETQRLESIYQRKITLMDELKKSLLQQAFAGEL